VHICPNIWYNYRLFITNTLIFTQHFVPHILEVVHRSTHSLTGCLYRTFTQHFVPHILEVVHRSAHSLTRCLYRTFTQHFVPHMLEVVHCSTHSLTQCVYRTFAQHVVPHILEVVHRSTHSLTTFIPHSYAAFCTTHVRGSTSFHTQLDTMFIPHSYFKATLDVTHVFTGSVYTRAILGVVQSRCLLPFFDSAYQVCYDLVHVLGVLQISYSVMIYYSCLLWFIIRACYDLFLVLGVLQVSYSIMIYPRAWCVAIDIHLVISLPKCHTYAVYIWFWPISIWCITACNVLTYRPIWNPSTLMCPYARCCLGNLLRSSWIKWRITTCNVLMDWLPNTQAHLCTLMYAFVLATYYARHGSNNASPPAMY